MQHDAPLPHCAAFGCSTRIEAPRLFCAWHWRGFTLEEKRELGEAWGTERWPAALVLARRLALKRDPAFRASWADKYGKKS